MFKISTCTMDLPITLKSNVDVKVDYLYNLRLSILTEECGLSRTVELVYRI